ncbi:hypothetical protein BC826DRAFT_1185792 [Russula brevipes]|nr:hypothetical protein BC826DRAFT_1185792 [Russula brevipes]
MATRYRCPRQLSGRRWIHGRTTVQVKNTDFELLRPNPARPRLSEDSSSANGKSSGIEGRLSFLRVACRRPDIGRRIRHTFACRPSRHIATSAMSLTPSSHARKSKKTRKLLQEGLPRRVRYQVWAHLTDSRAKRTEGLYVRLGLAFIAGQLLLQSPEEDAFWIFISLMDLPCDHTSLPVLFNLTYMRRCLHSPTVVSVSRSFSSLFVGALPSDYFQRVWDVFLSEGVVFLFPVGLAIVTCCYRTLLGVHQETKALESYVYALVHLATQGPQ